VGGFGVRGTGNHNCVSDETVDAVVVGAGPNGLVAACRLADAGWDVCLLEANERVGGAVASVEHTPGYVSDLYSAFYPLAYASPAIAPLDLGAHGLRWLRSPDPVAHLARAEDERCAVVRPRAEDTAAELESEAPGDGEAWMRLVEQWQVVRDDVLGALFTPFPPVRNMVGLLRRLGTADALRLARTFLLPVHRMGTELFAGESPRLLLAGNAMHADVPTVAPGSGAFGWIMTMLAQEVGYPVPEGGSGQLAEALRRRAEAAGAQVVTGARVTDVVVRGGRALGVRTADGRRVRARRAVLADVAAPTLYRRLLPEGTVPQRLLDELDRSFEWDLPTVKVNWALDGPVPWRATGAAGAGTVHLGADVDQLASWSTSLSTGQDSPHVFQILGQLATADPSRAPAGGQSLWGYSHLPRGAPDAGQAKALADRMHASVEAFAPGFSERVVDRWEQLPGELEADDANLVEGAINGGTAQIYQQMVFRPTTGLGRPETPVLGLYLAGAATSPGGGVHGACGANAARAALHGAKAASLPARTMVTLTRHLTR